MDPIILSGITSTGAIIVTWYLSKRQYKATVQNTELDAVEKAVAIWRNLAQDLKKEMDEMRVAMEGMRDRIDNLTTELTAVEHENDRLKREVDILKANKV